MPATSKAQAALMAIAEHDPDKLYAKNKSVAKMSRQQLHDFASTPRAGLPQRVKHMEDGGMTNTTFQQSETTRPGGGADWMERARAMKTPKQPEMPMAAPKPKDSKYRVRMKPKTEMLADGKKWAGKAFAHAGEPGHSLHASLGIPKDQKIPPARLNAATHSKNPKTRHQAQAAKNI